MSKIDEIRIGSKWVASDMQEFVIIATYIDPDKNKWIYYRSNDKKDNQGYSCLLESFLSRFNPYINGE